MVKIAIMKSRQFDKPNRRIVVIAHNIRSIQNVGSILRTCECLGVDKVYASGYTPNLSVRTDGSGLAVLPHVKEKLARELHRSALGAEEIVKFEYCHDINRLILDLKQQGYRVVGLEQNQHSVSLSNYTPSEKIALLLGEEVHGLTDDLIKLCDDLIEIPMFGQKESYNVSVATGIALYQLVIK